MAVSIFVVVNPVSGQAEPVLAPLARAWDREDVTWELGLTKPDRGCEEIIGELEPGRFDIIAAYGGDGTISAAANALAGRPERLGILPGGTGNVIAAALAIPDDVEQAASVILSGEPCSLDALEFDERRALMRIGFGADAAAIEGASRADKDGKGWLAYLQSAASSAFTSSMQQYRFELDGQEHELEGIALMVCNIGRIGRTGAMIHPEIDPQDGRLDVVVIESASAPFRDFAARHLGGRDGESPLAEATGEADEPPRVVHLSGERFRWLELPEGGSQVDGEARDGSTEEIRCLGGALEVLAAAP